MSRRLDMSGMAQVVSTGVQAWAAVELAKREAKTAASKGEGGDCLLRAVADFISRLSGMKMGAKVLQSNISRLGTGLPADSSFRLSPRVVYLFSASGLRGKYVLGHIFQYDICVVDCAP